MMEKYFEEKVFCDTKIVLENYREAAWNLEVEMFWLGMRLQKEYGMSLEEFLDMTDKTGREFPELDAMSCIESINDRRNMLRELDAAAELLRDKHPKGEAYYKILYYAYLSPQKVCNTETIIEKLEKDVLDISGRTYYRMKKKAIMELGWLLWGHTIRKTEPIIDKLLKEMIVQKDDTEECMK